ncbi:hypothetical protein PTSG_07643 [Salpingoeca rosetta]|uniref:Endonuclease/exonuclease/phosphatase domain-containing protein n=1 Tax=Salpingoeca rosetta (strain ATCC 50818 / BSB-021) TaxID=946362 RepID=F2UHC7_SALR5|nr:uncharacterized protein PTSG_07643 [Salpingoeca rosetta]EGD76526.1 hypothetical protein PTSG_07643 [Salpingoeca rosetta]|eukprot:XP_004991440.1 hypothetical protein PTSG_07643 [Salpingoeca rosetta]
MQVVTFNVLSPPLTQKDYFPYLTEDLLDPDVRWKMLVAELLDLMESDSIICLQEVDHSWFGKFVLLFEKEGYTFVPVTYSPLLGVAIAFPRARIGDLIPDCIGVRSISKLRDSTITAKRCWNVALQVHLTRSSGKGQDFAVTTYHMPCKFREPHVMAMHCSMLVKWAHNTANSLPYIVAGDFNIKPKDPCYDMIVNGFIHPEVKGALATPAATFNEVPKALRSALREHHGREPEFTNWTHEFQDTLDYIFLSDEWVVRDACDPESFPEGPYPSERVVSDHIPLWATLDLVA